MGQWFGRHNFFWPIYLVKEMFRWTDLVGQRINVSDGGHTGDNCSLYPLLQRRCEVIIACDGGRDPEYRCTDLASAIRQANVDENVEVHIDASVLKPDPETGRSAQQWVVGRIRYPDHGDKDGEDPDLDGQIRIGWLIYLKTSLVAQQTASVQSYAAAQTDFPHQSTADQFFTDAQFEAYRSLGHEIGASLAAAIAGALEGSEDHDRHWHKHLDGWARHEWHEMHPDAVNTDDRPRISEA